MNGNLVLFVVIVISFAMMLLMEFLEERGKKMGQVNEYDSPVSVDANECITLLNTELNKCTVLSLQAIPSVYGVYINDDLIYSCNILKNAETIYQAIRADMAGKVYERRF